MSVERCNTPTSSEHVECKTPSIKSEAIKYLEEKEFLYGTVSIYTDTKHFELKESQIKIYRDPEFNYTKYTSEQLQKTKELKIQLVVIIESPPLSVLFVVIIESPPLSVQLVVIIESPPISVQLEVIIESPPLSV
ncbi:hypothetical protein BgiBS90_030326 [Biomphalaria glabrata]|nr:hypothetical protein BgiBS90_030326 [Biomphalaria glabrata]